MLEQVFYEIIFLKCFFLLYEFFLLLLLATVMLLASTQAKKANQSSPVEGATLVSC